MAHAARTRLSASERELQILHAAARVFARSNYRLAGTADIAREAGITEPTIYRYFPSKKDLFIRILKHVSERILENWNESSATNANALLALRRAGSTYFRGLRTHRDEVKIQFQALAESDDPDVARQLRKNHEGYVRFFAQLIERGQREGAVRGDVNPHAAGWLLNGIGFTVTLVRLLGFDHGASERQISDTLVNASVSWLAGPSKRTPGEPARRKRHGAR